ncbi:MAG TPA: PhnD/SsuA/transferrin family substrate-binding protein [Gemmataceae bacterium]|nr:PhnD/SsuA/transferrin family substrate-binding protein [Gemmataceae bacterium]
MVGLRLLVRGAVVFAVALLPAVISRPAGGEEALDGHKVQVGVVRSLFPDTPDGFIPIRVRPFKALLDAQSGLESQIRVSGTAQDLARELSEGKVQLGVFHGIEYGWVRQKFPRLQPLVVAVPRKELRAALVVRKDSAVRNIEDLKGKTVALPCQSREHCRIFLHSLCRGCGDEPERFFQLTKPANFEQALAFVLSGRVQGAVLDAVLLDWYHERQPERFAQLKVVQESPAFPGGVIVYCPNRLSEGQRERIRDGLLAANKNSEGVHVLDLCQISHFEQAPKDYDRSLTAIIKEYPQEDGSR